MRVRILLEGQLRLPIHHNNILQALVYDHIDRDLSDFLHKQGYQHGGRTYKMFTFSRLAGRYQMDAHAGTITYATPINFMVASPVEGLITSLAANLIKSHEVYLGKAKVRVVQADIRDDGTCESKIRVRSLSPITIYSTDRFVAGGSFTMYHQPGEEVFNDILTANIRNKYSAFFEKQAPDGYLQIIPVGKTTQNVIKHERIVIKGYSGEYQMEGPPELLQLGMAAGFGGKNAQGFGMMQLVERVS